MSNLIMQLTFLIVILTKALQMSLKLVMNCLLDVLPDLLHVCPETLGSVVFSV